MSLLNEVINNGCPQCDWGKLDHTFCISDEEYEYYQHLDNQTNFYYTIIPIGMFILSKILNH
jgi:hypothetical protein